jgi:two-component system, OmpR family, sensor histidine kinase KdpD
MTGNHRHDGPARLKLFLGYAAGVGKTYQMLDEAHALVQEGVDLVVGYFESHGRRDTIARVEGLEIIPRRRVDYRGATFEEMDPDAILTRNPALCLVDELAHTNVPGSAREKRWEDVQLLLSAGIDVHSTMNIQHLEGLNDDVYQFTGVRVRETVPDWFVRQANEVVMVDLTPEALRNRLARGVVYAPEKAGQALQSFFKEPTLAALRELALRQTAREVDARQRPAAASVEPERLTLVPPGSSAERILILVTEDPSSAAVIRRGRRVADYLGADCFAVAVCPQGDVERLPPERRAALQRHLQFARNLRVTTLVLAGERPEEALIEFARERRVSQILVGPPRAKGRLFGLGRRDLVFRLIERAKEFQVMVVAKREPQQP